MIQKREMQDAPGPHRQRVSKAKHAAILDAALEEFLKNGFSRAAMVEIADKAGVSTATLYKHFRSKEELFAAIVDHKLAASGNEVDASVFDLPVEDAIVEIGRIYLKVQFEAGINALMRVVIAEAPVNPALGRDFIDRVVVPRQKMFNEYFGGLLASQGLDIPDPVHATQHIMGVFTDMFIWPAMFDPEFQPPADAEAMMGETVRRFLAPYRQTRTMPNEQAHRPANRCAPGRSI